MSLIDDNSSTIIEIDDSSEESDVESNNPSSSSVKSQPPPESKASNEEFEPSNQKETQTPISRRKSAHLKINAFEDISFQSFVNKKGEPKRDDENEYGSSADMDDVETMQCLRRIAYCRVFTNYLLRQYDMLAIDFEMPSNLEHLLMELKKRVDTYKAIRRSRQQLWLNKDDS